MEVPTFTGAGVLELGGFSKGGTQAARIFWREMESPRVNRMASIIYQLLIKGIFVKLF